MARPKPERRMLEGLRRMRNNTDFTVYVAFLEADLAHIKDALITEVDPVAIAQLQGRARQLQDQLKYIHAEE